ncbi:glycerol-3-phosphate dehydrogenase/oxidase [Haloferula sp.]|uniref:glycerol-3-phosphate dehydrogenase/oxidase n=1 Tax=Haloferula sp. TaxID=2497595 RepID=UPI00329E0E49
MNRDEAIRALKAGEEFDFLVVGGGATGLGTAVDAASRGHRVALVEAHDFAKGTSSRSTKLVHGGVRYLKQGNISLVVEALKERGLLAQNAPHLVHDLAFVIPAYKWWDGPFYGIGLRIYDTLAGKLGLGPSQNLNREETLKMIPTIETDGLHGGILYHDGQFDDARLAVNLAQTAVEQGAVVANYLRAQSLMKEGGIVTGVVVRDQEDGTEFTIRAKAVINATGVFVDGLRKEDDGDAKPIVAVSQGVHLVLPKRFLPGESAIMVPQTEDGRVLFAVPWHDRVVVGTTDTPLPEAAIEPRALDEELDFLMEHARKYLADDPTIDDVLSVFAGLRPLVKSGDGSDTAGMSRDHTVLISESGLITVTGGKWTTYRKMGEDVVDQAEMVAGVEALPCRTRDLRIHGWREDQGGRLSWYGTDADSVEALMKERPALNEVLDEDFELTAAEVCFAVESEMARTVEDVLARRSRALLLDARAAIRMAPKVAELMAGFFGKDDDWLQAQVEEFENLARGYLFPPTQSKGG